MIFGGHEILGYLYDREIEVRKDQNGYACSEVYDVPERVSRDNSDIHEKQ